MCPNASTLVLLQQAAIPISMVISALAFVGVRYDRFQILGAAVVLLGIGVVLSPQLGSGQIVSVFGHGIVVPRHGGGLRAHVPLFSI